MKTCILSIIAIFPLLLSAQTVDHFQNASSRWFVADTYPNGNLQNPSFLETATTVYGFMGDTTLQGENWFKTYSSTDMLFSTELELQGFLREENGYVFFQDTTSTIDTLYNFNLEIGDSVLYDFWGQIEDFIHVSAIDSVPINGEMYKRLSFDEPIFGFFEMNEKWIEGIGSIHGPLFPLNPESFSQEMPDILDLVCSHVDETLYWYNEDYDQCFVNIILDAENATTADFEIYPNPTTGAIIIRQNQDYSGQFFIYDMLGKEMCSGWLQSGSHSVDLNGLKSGVYLVSVVKDNATITKRVVKY